MTKPKSAPDLSQFNPAEREIIDLMQRDQDQPLTQEQINLSLKQARAIYGDDLNG
jgi:hypothetical protein